MSRAIESSFFDHSMIDANKILNTNVEGDHHTPFKVQIGQNFLNLTRWFLLTFRSDLNLTRWFLLDSGAFLDPVLSVFPLRNRILGVPKSPKFSACGGPNLIGELL